jgi:hypothetical protein
MGKTQFLSKMALGMSGQNPDYKNNFNPGRPLFGKVIAISYSIFDSFEKPLSKEGFFSYIYCGLKDENNNVFSNEIISDQLCNSIIKIDELNKTEVWTKLLAPLFSENDLKVILTKVKNENTVNIYDSFYFSFGQGIIFNCITHLLANIERETLVIYDEPEMHLHPNGVSKLISILHKLLTETNSYAIVATHSPIIVQQIPSKYVRIISKIDSMPNIKRPFFETFGENLSSITNEIFGNISETEYYKEILKKTIDYTTEYIEKSVFEGKLSLNARIFLEGENYELD